MTEEMLQYNQKKGLQRDFYEGLESKDLAKHFAQSGYFADAREMSQAVVKILAGQEIGIPPVAAMRNIDFIDGELSLRGRALGALIRESDKYDYEIVESTPEKAVVKFFDASGEELGTQKWTIDMAEKSGLTGKNNWAKYPHKMLFWRALSDGADIYCPDLFYGAYTRDEVEHLEGGDGRAEKAKSETESRTEELKQKVVERTSDGDNASPDTETLEQDEIDEVVDDEKEEPDLPNSAKDISGHTVREIKRAVREGFINARSTYVMERKKKKRKTLMDWLEDHCNIDPDVGRSERDMKDDESEQEINTGPSPHEKLRSLIEDEDLDTVLIQYLAELADIEDPETATLEEIPEDLVKRFLTNKEEAIEEFKNWKYVDDSDDDWFKVSDI